MMSKKISILVIGCGNMGASHATAYHNHDGFEICGLVSRGKSKNELNDSLKSNYKLFIDYKEAITSTNPDAVCISTYPDTHEEISFMLLSIIVISFLKNQLLQTLMDLEKSLTKLNLAERN